MTMMEAIKKRHSVRSYLDKKIPEDIRKQLQDEICACNQEGGLNIQLVLDEPKAFTGIMAHYGKFRGVQNYIALIGEKSEELDEKLGYYGEKIVLVAQRLGLNTCWVALTFRKGVTRNQCQIGKNEKLICVIALGYGKSQGIEHKSKAMEDVCQVEGEMPDWFKKGMEAALLAPTAVNQQKFFFSLHGNVVLARETGGVYSKIDLGIVKYHFEIGAGKENFRWK